MGNFKVYTTSNKRLCQTAPSAWKCSKIQFWGPLSNWKFEPSPTLSKSPHNNKHTRTGQKTMSGFIMACTDLSATGKNSLTHALKSKDLAILAFKKFQTYPPKPAEVESSFRKVSLPTAKFHMLFPAHLWVREFWLQIYSIWQALDWGLLSKILACMKIGWA